MGSGLCNFQLCNSYERLQKQIKNKAQLQKYLSRYPLIQQKFKINKKYFPNSSYESTQINRNFILFKQTKNIINNHIQNQDFYSVLLFEENQQAQHTIPKFKALFYQGGFSQSNLKQGKGYAIFDNGDTYQGQWKNNTFSGHGIYTSNLNNFIYQGQFKNWKKQGKGKIISQGPNRFIYEGQFKNDQITGKGKIIYENQAQYEGQMKNGLQQGYGIYRTKQMKYEGTWTRGQMSGSGSCYWHSKDGEFLTRYTGEYHEGKKHGFGQYQTKDKKLKRGQWYQGKFRPGINSYIVG